MADDQEYMKALAGDDPATRFAALPVGPEPYTPTLFQRAHNQAITPVGWQGSHTLVDGSTYSTDDLRQDPYGAKLVELRHRTDRYGFLDGLTEGSWLSKLPFLGFFATVGSDLSAASDAAHAFEKMQRGESLTRDEAIKATLWTEEQNMRANGTGWYTFGSIVGQAPSFMLEMGMLGGLGGMARTAAVKGLAAEAGREASESAVRSLARFGTTRMAKTGTFEYAPEIVRSAIAHDVSAGLYASEQVAAKALLGDSAAIRHLAGAVSANTRKLMDMTAPHVVDYSTWAPGLRDKVASKLAEDAVRADLAYLARSPGLSRAWDAARRTVGRSVSEGLLDLGGWGSESATVLTTGISKASRAFGQAAMDFTIGAWTRGVALFLPREAIAQGLSLASEVVTGNELVRRQTLGLKQAAWQNDDPELMSSAETYGMFLDLLEYASENTGRGFNSLMRGIGLATGVSRPAARVAGLATARGAQFTRAGGGITGLDVSVGLVDAANSAQAGGAVGRYVEKVFGGRSLQATVAEDRMAAARYVLGRRLGAEVADTAALRTTIATGVVQPGLPQEIANAMGPNVEGFVKGALKQANRERVFGGKIHGWLRIYAADFMARHNFDAQRAWESFKTMGYDGIVAEMFEERYNDFVQEMFGLDAQRKDFHERIGTAVQRLFVPEGGWKQLLAEAAAFAVPAVVRSGVSRTIAAMGSENDYAKSAAWSANIGDVLKYGTTVTFRSGDYLAMVDDQIAKFRSAREEQERTLERGHEEGVPLSDLRRTDLEASVEGYRRGERRARRVRDVFAASLGVDVRGGGSELERRVRAEDELIFAPVYTDADLTAENAEFEQRLHETAESAKRAMAAYRDLVEFAPTMAQLQYKARHKTADESDGWFRKAAHWVAEHAVRAAGFVATGDLSFLSANPARFAAVDKGVDRHLLDVMEHDYRQTYEAVEQEMRSESADGSVDTESAHARALERFRSQAQADMALYLAASQVHMFSEDEISDIALAKVAEDDGFVVDTKARRLIDRDLGKVSFDEYLDRPGVRGRVDAAKSPVARMVFEALTATDSERADASVLAQDLNRRPETDMLRAIMRIPKGLPTADLAVMSVVLRHARSFTAPDGGAYRSAMVERRLDPEHSLDDQLSGIATPLRALSAVAQRALEGHADPATASDFEKIVNAAADSMDPEVLESIARALNYSHDFTEGGLRSRNRQVVRYALQAQTLLDPAKAVFSRPPHNSEDGDPLSPEAYETVVARDYGADGWAGVFVRSDGTRMRVSAPTLDALEQAVATEDFGYARRARRVIHTPVKVVYGDSAQDFVYALNLTGRYRELQDEASLHLQGHDDADMYKDPALRRDPETGSFPSRADADRIRREEAALAAMFEAKGYRSDGEYAYDYLMPGESRADESAMRRAGERQRRAATAWAHREGRDGDNVLGYNALAVGLVNAHGVFGGRRSRLDNLFAQGDPALRGKFAMSVKAYNSRMSGDIYVPIDHENAQSYSASILTSAIDDVISQNKGVLQRGGMMPRVRGLLSVVEDLVYNPQHGKIAQAQKDGNAELENTWRAFGEWSVEGVSEDVSLNSVRRSTVRTTVSPDVLGTFIQAFCLFRTEVPDRELYSALGPYAYQLKELAPAVRKSSAFLSFSSAADFVLGGTGFDTHPESSRARGGGLAYYYARFAPSTKSYEEAVADVMPGGYDAYVASLRNQLREGLARTGGQVRHEVRDIPEPPGPTTPPSARMPLDAARDAVAAEFGDAPLTPEQDATVASLLGGTTDAAEAVPPPGSPEASASSTSAQETPQDAPRQGATSDLTIGDGWEMLDMQPAAPADTPIVDAQGERVVPESKDVSELTDDEAMAFGATLARAMGMTLGDTSLGGSTAGRPQSEVLEFLSKVAPSMSDRDKERVAAAYTATGGRYVGDDKWVFTDADNDEEGVVPDGVEFNGLRNVNILKSDAFKRLLAIISRVSPATGRDFQPFVEDLRDFVYSAPYVLADQMATRPDLASAVDFLRGLLNPRANNDYDDQLDAANARDAAHHRLLTWFVPPSPGREAPNWAKLQIFVSELLQGDTPVCARAGMFLAHLMGQTPETLSQMLSFVSNSAPATPVQLREVRTAKGEIAFMLQPAVPKKNTPSPDMLTASFLRLAGKSPAEVRAKADELDAVFKAEYDKAAAEGWSGYLTSVPKQSGRRTDHHGLMDVYARAMSKVFGSDSPVAVPFVSRLFDRSMARASAEGRERGGYARLLQDFVFSPDGVPLVVKDISDMLREVADASTGEVTREALSNAAVAVFQSGGPRLRQANFAPASTMDVAPWSRLLLAFSESKPVSVMTADVDPARNRGAKPSLAITMPGVEPALQQFLDRDDDRGFRKRLAEWFPEAFSRRDFDIGLLRQRMEWPGGVGIVAKNTTKTAYATEVFAGARAAYEAKDATMLYVPVYSGDHSSSIIVQIPIAKALKAKGYSYIEAATMVSRMLGMDLFGVDAKRSAVTCLEAPAVSLWGFGEKTDDTGKFVERGHVKYAVLWNSAPGADNEAFKGSLSLFGYGAKRLRMLSRDRNLAAVKCHIAPTGDDKWGTMPGLTKALATAYFPGAEKLGTFLEGSPMEKLVKFAEGLVSDGLSSAIVTDADSVKMDVLNSKMICVRTGDGKYKTIMDYVLNERLRQYLDHPENAGKSVTLADVMGGEAVSVWNRAEDKEVFNGDLADFIPGLELRDAKDGMYALIRDADNFTAFQVANVAHAAEADDGELSRNYVMDIGNLAVTLGGHNADTVAGTQIYKNAAAVTGSVRELMTSYGMLAAALVRDPKSIEIRLENDEEYKALKAAGLPTDGDLADEIRRRVYAAWVREVRTPPVTTIPAALEANGAWIEAVRDPATGRTRLVGRSHSKSAMFNDTLQGPRSIAKEDREFMRAAHRVALCNVNCADPAFRHGLYINEDILGDAQFKAQGWVPEWGAGTGVSKRDALVQLVERIVTEIVQAPQTDAEGEQGLRELFGTYLYDHRGTTLFDRQVPDGRSAADAVSYLDLFTQATSANGSFQFDRAAIYERMHDKDGKVCFYLGGTMFGLPRTPSYNGQVQQVRAALPVAKIDDAENPEQWREGKDAWVAPDPFTLKILGCDHDGDKSALYLLDLSGWHIEGDEGRKFALTPAEIQALFAGAEDIRSPQGLAAWRERLTEQGVFHRTGSGELRFDRTFAKRLANTVALGAFDLNRMLPVFDDEGDVSLYAGYRADGERLGDPWRGTKTTPGPNMQKPEDPPDLLREKATSPGSAWDVASGQEGVLAPKVLDLEVPAKRLENVETAMKVQTSGKLVSEARARFVAAARDFHALRLAGFDNVGFMALVESSQDFIDLLYHLDGPNNMSFDDMKEQVCSRLGLLPGMIDTFLAEYSGLVGGDAALTDRAAVANAAAYGRKVNDPNHFYHWMKRASDPSDTEFRNMWAESVRKESIGDKDVERLESLVGTDVALALVRKAEDGDPLEPAVGILYAARTGRGLDNVSRWVAAVRQLEDQRRIAASLNYTYSDPGEDSSAADWEKAVSEAGATRDDGTSVYSAMQKRMLLATGFLNGGIGSTFANRGVSAVHNVDVNFRRALAGIPAKGASTFEGMFLAAASYTPKLGWDKTIQAANNARMVGRAAAAFANPLAVPGSPFNSDDADPVSRFYRQCSLIAEAVASARHPARKAAVGSRPAVQTNATLDFCWFVESAVDLVSRLVASQPGVERDFQLSDYIREMPSGAGSMFDSGTYGPAAENSARITLALGGLSSDTLRRSQEVLGRVVYGRELDSDGELGKRPFQPRGRNKPVAGVSFALSEQSLRALALYFSRLSTKRNVKAEARGEQRDLAGTARMLADVLKSLTSRHPDLFPPGFTIQPSALFGQMLPAYASITDFVDGAPGPDSRALQMLFPNDVIMQEEAVRDARSNAHLAPYLSLAESFDWSAKTQNRQKFKDEPATARSRSATAAAAMKAGAKLDSSLLDQVDPETGKTLKKLVKAAIKESGSGLYWDEDQPAGGPRFLGVFDGTRGAAFEALVAMFRNAPVYAAVDARSVTPTYWPSYNETPVQVWAPGRKEPSAQTPGAVKSPYGYLLQQPVRSTPTPAVAKPSAASQVRFAPERNADSPRVNPAVVTEIARTVGQVFRLWSDAHIRSGEDDQSFSITANMRVAGETRPVRMNVRVSREIAGASEDAVIRTLAMRTGRTEDELRKDSTLLASLKARYSVAGRTTRPTAFRLSTSDVGVLTADVELAAANAIKDATAFHEAFHAATEFAYAVGVLSEADIAELAKKYNKKGQTHKRPDGSAWFDTEAAANDFQELLKGGLSEARKEPKGVVERILQKLFEFVKSLAAALKGVIASHTSEDFGRDVRENPLTGFVLTGELNPSTLAEQAVSMDEDAQAFNAVNSAWDAVRRGSGHDPTPYEFGKLYYATLENAGVAKFSNLADPSENDSDIWDSDGVEGALSDVAADLAQFVHYAGLTWDQFRDEFEEGTVDIHDWARIKVYVRRFMQAFGPENHGPSVTDADGNTFVAEPGADAVTPNRDSAAALGVKPNPYEYLKTDPRRTAVAAFFDAQNYHPTDREAAITKWLERSTPERIAEIVAQYGGQPTAAPAGDESAATAVLDDLDMQPVIPKVREELDRVGIPRMAVPYSKADTLAAAVGSILRQGETPDAVGAVDALAPVNDKKSQQYTDWQVRRMRDAVRRLSSLYGVAQNDDDRGRERLLFRALNEVAEDLQQRQNQRNDQMKRVRTRVSAAGLAAKVAVASGVRPCDILEAALHDVLEIRSRCNSKLAAALDERMLPVLRRLYAQSADPTGLLKQFAPAESEGPTEHDPHDVFAELSAGVVSDRDPQGNHLRYRVTNLDANGRPATGNPFAPANIAAYKDHEQDRDFQDAMRTALDAVYMVAASRSMYEDLGFTPGDPHVAADAAGAMSVLEMLAAAGASPDMYSDPSFRVVGPADEGWFSAAAPQEWLDSMMRPSFGGVDLRAMAQGVNRAVAQFQHRVTALRNLHACEYGVAGNPGDPLIALDPDYKARFSWKDGRIRADVDPTSDPRYGEVRAYQRQNRVAFRDGNGDVRRMDRVDVRWVDLLLKARAAHMTGSRYLVTGVNGISFSLEDVADESYYARERVRERCERGRSGGQSYFDLALERLDIQLADSYGEGFDGIVDSGEGRYGLRDRFVGSACAALREAKRLVELTESGALTADEGLRRSDVNDYVIRRLARDGVAVGVQSFHGKTPKYTSAALALDVDRVEELFGQTEAYRKLTDAGRKPEWLSREAYERPYLDLLREMRSFANANPYFTDGDGRFFLGVTSPLHFSRGGGATLWGLGKAPERDALQTAVEVQSQFASDLEDLLRGSLTGVAPARDADARALRMLRAVYRLPNSDVESMRYALEQGQYEGVNGCPLTKDSTARDLLDAITSRLRDLVWGEATDGRGLEEFGGPARVRTLLEKHWADPDPTAVANVSGLSQDAIFRMTGTLPANFEAGHAVQSMVDGLSNAIAYRATLVNMVTTPDADGMPLCYAKPSLVPDETGLPDAVWGAVARWWGELHNLAYDGTKTGVENARAMYEEIVEHGRIDRKDFGTLSKDDMDSRAVDEFVARKGVPEGESELNRVAGGYALGYAKHLFQSTRGLGGKWQRAIVHRALAYSKAMSVSFSLFFPLATKYESPIGAVGLAATVGGTLNADFMREHADAIRKVLGATGLGWVTRDFVGEQDFAKMLDSNDPFLSDMYRFASAIGLTMSTSLANPLEHSRGVMQQDLADFTGWVRRNLGDKAAKKVADASGTLLTRASEKAFTYHLNAVKLAVASQMCMKLQADAQARGIAFDPVRDMRRYSSYMNAEVGGIDPLQYAWLHPGMRSRLESTFFSWNWTRGAWEAGGGKILEQVLFGGHDVTPEERRYMLGRAIRMWGWVAFGLPTVMQLLVKAVGMGIDPDHEDRDDEKWWIWENEDKAFMKSFNLRPLMRAIAKRFPAYAELRGEHPVVAGLPMLGFAATRNPWLLGAAVLSGMPVQTGKDEQNVTGNRAYYMHFAKQAWEFERWFDAPFQQFLSKLSMPVQRLFEGLTGRSLTMPDMKFAWHDKGDAERWLYPTGDSATVNMLKAFLPFSMAGLTQYGDAGLLPVLGPVSMGTSGGAAMAALADELDKWASNDRRGYAFGGRLASDRSVPRASKALSDNPVVRRYVGQLRANGFSEPQILSLLDRALGNLSSKRIRRLVDLVPDEADGAYDTREFGRLVRELRRLGRTRRGIYKSVRDRLERAGREPAAESRARATEIIANEVARPYTY